MSKSKERIKLEQLLENLNDELAMLTKATEKIKSQIEIISEILNT